MYLKFTGYYSYNEYINILCKIDIQWMHPGAQPLTEWLSSI